jgi:CRP-like cAMP-binding protein
MLVMQTPPIDGFELLSGTGLVSGMSLEQIQVLSGCGKLEVFSDGEALVTWDDTHYDLLIVLEGKCEIRTQMNDLLYALRAGSLIGEVSFLDKKQRSAQAFAVGECKAIRFPASLLEDLETSRPDVIARLLKNISVVLCQKLRSTTRFAEASFV